MTEDGNARKVVIICCVCKKIKVTPHHWDECNSENVPDMDEICSHGICPECMVSELSKIGITI